MIKGGTMRSLIVLIFIIGSSCFAQKDSILVEKMNGTILKYPSANSNKFYFSSDPAPTDSIYIEMMNGSIRKYSIPSIKQIYFSSNITSIRDQEAMQTVLSSFVLLQNYPNPFNPSTTIQYQLPNEGVVNVNIYDIQGQLVRSLLKSNQFAGSHSLVWDSKNDVGSNVSSGTYFCQVLFGGSALIKKLILIK